MGRKLSFQEVQERINDINPNIQIIGEYTNTHTKVLCRCSKCNYEWAPTPDKLLQGRGCPSCSKRIKGTKEQLQQKLDNLSKTLRFQETIKIEIPPLRYSVSYVGISGNLGLMI